jgi:hypothetical protein
MKKIIITAFATLMFSGLFSQTDSVKIYQYRIELSNVTTLGSFDLIKNDLSDLFKSKLSFYDQISQIVFTSTEDVDKYELQKFIMISGYDVKYFKKEKISN